MTDPLETRIILELNHGCATGYEMCLRINHPHRQVVAALHQMHEQGLIGGHRLTDGGVVYNCGPVWAAKTKKGKK